MSDQEKNSLKVKLNQLQCHFTWTLQKGNIDLDDMKRKLEDSIQLDVTYKARSYNHLAFVNCLQGNCEEAIQNLKEAEKILRENHKDEFEKRIIVTYGNYAWVNYHMGQLTEAQSYLDKLERICQPIPDASRYTAMIPEVYGEKGWSLLSSSAQYYDEAKECFKKAVEEDSANIEWNFGLAIALSRVETRSSNPENVEYSESVKQFRRVLELDPDHAESMVLLALKLQEINQSEEALELVEEALQKSPDLPHVIRYAAKFYRKEGDVKKAVDLLKKGLKITPNSAFLHHQIGVCYKRNLNALNENSGSRDPHNPVFQQKVKLINLCKQYFGKAFELKQSFILAKLGFAEICAMKEEYCEAEEIYKELLKLENITLENKQEIYLQVGNFEWYQKKSESNAIKYYLEGFKIKSDSISRDKCRINLVKMAEKLLCKNPRDMKAFCIRGIMYMVDGKEYFEKVLEFELGNED